MASMSDGSIAAAARAYPVADGWKRSAENMRWSASNSGPRMSPSDTVRPPASTTAMVWAAASIRLHRRATVRSGWAIGSIVPRSGQVADDDRAVGRDEPAHGLDQVPYCLRGPDPVRDVVRADHDDREGRRGCQRAVDLVVRGHWRPLRTCPTVRSCTGRRAAAASPRAISAPGVSSACSTPSPTALESPSSTMLIGTPPAAPVQAVGGRRVAAPARRQPFWRAWPGPRAGRIRRPRRGRHRRRRTQQRLPPGEHGWRGSWRELPMDEQHLDS